VTADTSAYNHDRAPIELPQRVRLEILAAVLLGIFLAALDQTIVGTALPVIVTDLQGNDVYVWAFTAYLLTATVSGPIWGKLSDLFGRRPIFLIGVSVFLVGSLLCGVSQTMPQFLAFRAFQGLGAGALFPIALAIIGDIFAPSERGKYQGFFGAVFGVSSLIGPALGGLITDNFGWHWIFFVNIPLCSWSPHSCRSSSASRTSSSANGPILMSVASSRSASSSRRHSCSPSPVPMSRSCR
jgi:MFS family permease